MLFRSDWKKPDGSARRAENVMAGEADMFPVPTKVSDLVNDSQFVDTSLKIA